MVETAKTQKIPEMTKRARWEKIKKELLKAPKLFPEIMVIAIDYKYENIHIIVSPVSASYELKMYDVARKLRNTYGIDLDKFYIYNKSDFKSSPIEDTVKSSYRVIYER